MPLLQPPCRLRALEGGRARRSLAPPAVRCMATPSPTRCPHEPVLPFPHQVPHCGGLPRRTPRSSVRRFRRERERRMRQLLPRAVTVEKVVMCQFLLQVRGEFFFCGGEKGTAAMVVRTAAVVIADDDEDSSARVAAALRRAGYPTVSVATGSDALEAARADDVGLLVLEVALPDMTGYEVCRMLRDEGDELPIFFVSGTHTDSVDRVAGLLLGADDFIVKPVDCNELVARVHRLSAGGCPPLGACRRTEGPRSRVARTRSSGCSRAATPIRRSRTSSRSARRPWRRTSRTCSASSRFTAAPSSSRVRTCSASSTRAATTGVSSREAITPPFSSGLSLGFQCTSTSLLSPVLVRQCARKPNSSTCAMRPRQRSPLGRYSIT